MQDEVNQDYSEQNEVDGMKKGADFSYMTSYRLSIVTFALGRTV